MNPFLTLLLAAAVASPTEDAKQKLVFLSDNGPVVIELNITLDGKPFRAAHRDFMTALFDALDKDKDGVLSKDEAARAPSPVILAGPAGAFGGIRGGSQSLRPRATREETAAFYAKNGLPAFGLSFTPRNTGVMVLNNLGRDDTSAEAINARLFELLDTDKDGKLSKMELDAAAGILSKFDDDEDEMLTSAELQGKGGVRSDDYGGTVAIATAGGPTALPGNRLVYAVGDDGVTPDLGRRLLSQYGKKGLKTLTRKQIGLSSSCYERLDKDEDGLLDESELARVGSLPPDASFTIRLGKRGDKEPLIEAGQTSKQVKATPSGEGVVLSMGHTQLELRGPTDELKGINVNFNAREQYVNQFKMADTDNNGYLDKAEAEKSGFFRNTFSIMDEDGDGMLFEKEMLAYVDRVEGLRKQASKSCLTLTLSNDGKGLFEMLDLDGDGKLSVRELRQASKLIEKLDRDKDGALETAEVPKRFKGSFDLGSSAGGNGGRNVVVFRAGMDTPTTLPTKTKGPVWFRKMDRNRDGDVSLREWLGTEAEFRQVDADGDGLISAEEADRYDKAKRGEQE